LEGASIERGIDAGLSHGAGKIRSEGGGTGAHQRCSIHQSRTHAAQTIAVATNAAPNVSPARRRFDGCAFSRGQTTISDSLPTTETAAHGPHVHSSEDDRCRSDPENADVASARDRRCVAPGGVSLRATAASWFPIARGGVVMSAFPGHSRRALVGATAALAAAPVVTAKKRKRKKPRKSQPPAPPPLAFAVVVVTDLNLNASSGLVIYSFTAIYRHSASGLLDEIEDAEALNALTLSDSAREQLVSGVQVRLALALELAGHDVPAERIAVTLL
jgi:hypothetical protein